jgi:RsiW-degrading membrane proteinase PrsW (M82 family)
MPPPELGAAYSVGTPVATRANRPRLPRKWMGPSGGWIIIAVLFAIWLIDVLPHVLIEHSAGDVPTAILIGGFGVAAAFLYTMAYRLRPVDLVSPMRLVIACLVGGLFATTIAGPINEGVNLLGGSSFGGPATLLALSLAGVVEEAVKISMVILVSRGLVNRSARNGLFIGGAVGFGFAAFEDMQYDVSAAHMTVIAHSFFASYASVSAGRAILGPFEHPVFTALFAAALFGASRNGRFRLTFGVIGAYLGVAAVHGLIDSSGKLLELVISNHNLAVGLGGLVTLLLALGSGAVWLVVSRRLRNKAYAAPPDADPPVAWSPPPALA